MRRDQGVLLEYEVEILRAAFTSDEGVYPYGYAQATYRDSREMIESGAVYRRFVQLEKMGMLEKLQPIRGTSGPLRVPYELTVLGAITLAEVVPDLGMLSNLERE